jgi:hypothetical protein
MDEVRASALELDAKAIAATPLLGYRIVGIARPGDGSATEVVRQLRVSQPWIEIENSPITIDIELFWACRPLTDLLADKSELVWFVKFLPDVLADFGSRWAISPQLHDRVSSSDSEGLAIVGGGAEALVWREGMVVGAPEPLATTLRLLIANFSAASRRAYVYSNSPLLESALGLLSDDMRSRYVPGAKGFIEQAAHELVFEKQKWLKNKALKHKIGPSPTPGR